MRGIEVKEDTYAIIKVIQADGTELALFDAGSPDGLTSSGYANFLLQSVQEARMEKHQIVETFGDAYIFFFGENPRFLDVQAVLLNTHDFNWRAEWWQNYHEYLRGTKLAELGARIYLFYDDIVIEGYMMQAVAQDTSQEPYTVALSFKLFITNYSNISFVQPPENALYPIRSSVQLPEEIDLTSGTAAHEIQYAARTTLLDRIPGETITDAVREQIRSVGYPEGVHAAYGYAQEQFLKFLGVVRGVYDQDLGTTDLLGGASTDLVYRKDNPLRGRIAENLDEYTGLFSVNYNPLDEYSGIPSAAKRTVRQQLEVEDLFRESIQFLSCYGADINDSKLLFKLGLGPNFKPKLSVQDSTTFSPTGGQEESLTDFYNRQKDNVTNTWDRFKKDPLDSVFGRQESDGSTFGPNRQRYTQGAGDPLYGYPTDFGEGQPGFGVPGFGDLGGVGFGSGSGQGGDPGFKDPSKFTFAGVANNASAFERFIKPKEDNTTFSFNAGATAGTSGLSGGAVTNVPGVPSSFSLVSVPGILDETGQARQSTAAIAEKQAKQRFGFSTDNPFGVTCPKPAQGCSETDAGFQCNFSSSGDELSEGSEYRWP